MRNISSGRTLCAHRTGPVAIKAAAARISPYVPQSARRISATALSPWAHGMRPDGLFRNRRGASRYSSLTVGAWYAPRRIIPQSARRISAAALSPWAHDMRPDGLFRNRRGASPRQLSHRGRMICAPTDYSAIGAVHHATALSPWAHGMRPDETGSPAAELPRGSLFM